MAHSDWTGQRRRRAAAALVAAPWVAWVVLRVGGLDRFWPFVLVVGFTPWAALTAPVPVVVALLLGRRGVAAVALVACLALAAVVAPRGLGGGAQQDEGLGFTVMSANLYVGRADVTEVLRIARRERVDVLVLEEATEEALRRLDRAGAPATFPRRATDGQLNAILVRRGVRARFGTAGSRVDVRATLGEAGVRVVAVHPLPPVRRAWVEAWRADLRGLPPAPRGRGPLTVLAGDFNATLDHRELRAVLGRGYRDAADVAGGGLRPTWPDERLYPPIAIDHVLADRRLDVRRYEVHDVARSDHHAVVAELVPRP